MGDRMFRCWLGLVVFAVAMLFVQVAEVLYHNDVWFGGFGVFVLGVGGACVGVRMVFDAWRN